jgi:cell wall-associated NlpC family hydrolase
MRRLVLLPLCLALVQPASDAAPAKSWAQPEIKLVTAQGLMGGGDPSTFRPDAVLTADALARLVGDLKQEEASTPAVPSAAVTLSKLDSTLVRTVGLGDAAASFAAAARAAGLKPPARFGTEVVARLIGLRINHPAGQDALELLPGDPATRAEAAYSAAQILRFDEWQTQWVADAAVEFSLPELTDWQRTILRTAVSLIGYPYVWAGTSEKPQAPLGTQVPGGFDCSGFVWRVYKLQRYAGAPKLASALRGRTTMEMSGEVPKARRIALADLEPADVLFFGAHGPRSKPAEVDHTGIYLGNGWFIHSSGAGVAVAPLSGWHADHFAWGRRPLAEMAVS